MKIGTFKLYITHQFILKSEKFFFENSTRNEPDTASEIVAYEISVIDKKFVLETYNIPPRYCAKVPDDYIKSTMDFIPI
jgi:hypothetical protein